VPLQEEKRQLTTTAFAYVGYPYVYAGEWDKKTGSGYCCGAQPIGGFDCSGYVWWLLKKYEGGYNAASVRGYAGWSLPERTSTDMAKNTGSHISFGSLRIGDIMMIADNGGSTWQDVDHVGVYLGNDWMIHSTGSEDGPTLEWVGDGWYHDMFVWGRRIAS
jgi:cell wall-associated NlpC family hydrolase